MAKTIILSRFSSIDRSERLELSPGTEQARYTRIRLQKKTQDGDALIRGRGRAHSGLIRGRDHAHSGMGTCSFEDGDVLIRGQGVMSLNIINRTGDGAINLIGSEDHHIRLNLEVDMQPVGGPSVRQGNGTMHHPLLPSSLEVAWMMINGISCTYVACEYKPLILMLQLASYRASAESSQKLASSCRSRMDAVKGKGKKGLIIKTWERCRSIGGGRKRSPVNPFTPMSKSRSWPRNSDSPEENKLIVRGQVAPEGCFSVYVGPQKQRFVLKTKYANHPLFKMLLEEAELEYGYNSEGPLALPCNVDLFYKVLSEMDSDKIRQGCNFAKGYGSYRLLSPSRMVVMNRF
ncbi:hypothetical protein HHK36_025218 [Tetracentron sinense]|uniref:Small auxin up regulated protein n=1 Tax=Tetracentron sinense TaxID=13715 RepID=A0A835D5F1_TETSI|nr:hypothetical protein HHK36_025218 [Tetracentron sinense]